VGILIFLAGLIVWLVLVPIVTIIYGRKGRPLWLRRVLTLLPMLMVLLAWATLGLPWDSMLIITAFGLGLCYVVHLFIAGFLEAKER
jgi:uncharacterized membrane protein YhdT